MKLRSFLRLLEISPLRTWSSNSFPFCYLQSRVEPPKKEVAFYMQYNVYVNVKHMVCNITDDAQVFLSLYDAKEERFIRYAIISWAEINYNNCLLHKLECFISISTIVQNHNFIASWTFTGKFHISATTHIILCFCISF